jgi:hypothetical protein
MPGRDGGTVDVGMACLSGMFESNDDVLYICYDNRGRVAADHDRQPVPGDHGPGLLPAV